MKSLNRHKKVISRWWFFVFSSIVILAFDGYTEVLSEEDKNTITMNLLVKNKKKSTNRR